MLTMAEEVWYPAPTTRCHAVGERRRRASPRPHRAPGGHRASLWVEAERVVAKTRVASTRLMAGPWQFQLHHNCAQVTVELDSGQGCECP